ncbi:MAG: cation-translocating P-type ATPase [Gammaproteobacteria bacterium]|nr:cation-translocating P-type ATPase [Gammaproteobacteria bacterium]
MSTTLSTSLNETPPQWHTLSYADALHALGSNPAGLSHTEATQRLDRYGPNELTVGAEVSAWQVLASQFKSALIVILLIATAISAGLGHAIESIAIAVIVSFAILLGFVQEFRAERAIAVLKEMTAPTARVLRNGVEQSLPARELVPGDVILVSAGDKVPADARLLEAYNLKADESPLTGESVPISKLTEVLENAALAIGDRRNLIYSGTTIAYGRGRALVVATGMRTQFGKISGLLATLEDPKTPLQRNLDRLGRVLAAVALVIVAAIVALGLTRGAAGLDMLIFGIALAVAVVPEALPAVVTISLALGVQRMAKRNALMRYLPAVETLGSTSVICTDKTGTLTRDEMTVRRIWIDGRFIDISGTGYGPEGAFSVDGERIETEGTLRDFLEAAVLCSDASLVEDDGRWDIKGDPSEGALLTAAAKAGISKAAVEARYPRLDEIPFSSERKRMTTLNRRASETIAYSKGAPEVILASCNMRRAGDDVVALGPDDRATVEHASESMAAQALRVLAVSCKSTDDAAAAENDMVFLGLAGLIDPPREEVAEAIATCNAAGIKPVMITGDHPQTGSAIARELGLLTDGDVVTGHELQTMSDAELERNVQNIEVYARVSPEQKIRVVDAWQKRGAVVAMTGDGVNDAPALKKADVGIAMGLTGTDVSREAADMTLTDDNFASIVSAMAEGRRVFSNIKKFLMFLLSANIGEIGVIAVATLAGLPLPLTAVQILFINLATDGLPALALATDPPEPGLMRMPPRDPNRSIFTVPVVALLVLGGLWSTIVGIGLFLGLLNSGRPLEEAMAMTFLVLVLIELFEAYSFRSDRDSILNSPFANRWLNAAVIGELGLLPLIVYVPILHAPFGTFALTASDWVLVGGLALTIVPVLELAKLVIRRGVLGQHATRA